MALAWQLPRLLLTWRKLYQWSLAAVHSPGSRKIRYAAFAEASCTGAAVVAQAGSTVPACDPCCISRDARTGCYVAAQIVLTRLWRRSAANRTDHSRSRTGRKPVLLLLAVTGVWLVNTFTRFNS